MYWYKTAPVQKYCKNKFLIKRRYRRIAVGGFHPHWVSTLYHVSMCVMIYSVLLHQFTILMVNEVLMH